MGPERGVQKGSRLFATPTAADAKEGIPQDTNKGKRKEKGEVLAVRSARAGQWPGNSLSAYRC